MSAFVEHSFKGGFLLDEPRLRKLKDIIENREIKNRAGPKIVYRVYRGDSYSYETESVDDVVNEDNEDWRRVTRLRVGIQRPDADDDDDGDHDDDTHFMLSFSDKDGCELRIAAEDRDRVFLLFSDLREYIQHEVTISRRIGKDQGRVLGLVLSICLMVMTLLSVMYFADHFEPEQTRQILDNPDVVAKMNFLIKHRAGPVTGRSLVIAGLGMTASFAFVFGFANVVISFIFPGNVFLFGKRKERFEKRQRLTSNLLWIVGVGLIVSVIAGFIVWRVTTRH